MGFFDFLIRRHVQEVMPRILDDLLPKKVEEVLENMFREQPDRELTKVGFEWAFFFALRKHWHDADRSRAFTELWDYIDVPHGTEGYEWTAGAAKYLAAEFVSEFGESA